MKNLEHLKSRLIERKQELEKNILNRGRLQTSDKNIKDSGDEVFSSAQESIEISIYNTEYDEFSRINKALELIESGQYGICQECEKQIPERRLEVYPNATLCLGCQELAESL